MPTWKGVEKPMRTLLATAALILLTVSGSRTVAQSTATGVTQAARGSTPTSASSGGKQTPVPGSAEETPMFKANVRLVLVDVVVTNAKGQPVTDMQKQDFAVWEEGNPQTVLFFEEHKGASPMPVKSPPLPPNVYANYETVKTPDSVNVLLLDALDTQLKDQVFVRGQMVKFLRNVRPAMPLAIFTLGSQLRMVKAFSADFSGVLEALTTKTGWADPQSSPWLPTANERDMDRQLIELMIMNRASPKGIAALREFQADHDASLTSMRSQIVLQALMQLVRYVSPIPGRKNIIWVAGSFPVTLLPQQNSLPIADVADIQRTTNLFSANQVAVYPISAEGLTTEAIYDTGLVSPPSRGAEGRQRFAEQAAMQTLAQETGGQAFYNTNGLGDAVNRSIDDGSHYYTLAYTPSDKQMDGKYRKIRVSIGRKDYTLAYRRGYYATDSKKDQLRGQNPAGDLLFPLMKFGMPDLAQIRFTVRVVPATPQPAPGAPIAGGNAELKGPLTRYHAEFVISTEDVALEATPSRIRRGDIQVELIAYDRDGKPVNLMTEEGQISLPPDIYESFRKTGLPVRGDIDVPNGGIYLRVGVRDPASGNVGTLGIPLNSPAPATQTAK
jgi:VWFA-related protein